MKIIIFLILFISTQFSIANSFELKIGYGVNSFPLKDKSEKLRVVLSSRENYNAHSFDVVSIYWNEELPDENNSNFHIIPFFDGDRENLFFTKEQGADCVVSGFKLLKNKDNSVIFLRANKNIENGFSSDEFVNFEYFIMSENKTLSIGHPRYYFNLFKKMRSLSKYCDVNDAIKNEISKEYLD